MYVPLVNWLLLVAAVGLVLAFGSANALAGAYGVAVSGTMVLTTILASAYFRRRWGWAAGGDCWRSRSCRSTSPFSAPTSSKIDRGGWLPAAGRRHRLSCSSTPGRAASDRPRGPHPHGGERALAHLSAAPPLRAPGTAVYLSRDQGVPRTLLHNLAHNPRAARAVIVLLTVHARRCRASRKHRLTIERHAPDLIGIVARYGYMERPNIPRLLHDLKAQGVDVRPRGAHLLPRPRPRRRHPQARHGPLAQAPLRVSGQQRATGDGELPACPANRCSRSACRWRSERRRDEDEPTEVGPLSSCVLARRLADQLLGPHSRRRDWPSASGSMITGTPVSARVKNVARWRNDSAAALGAVVALAADARRQHGAAGRRIDAVHAGRHVLVEAAPVRSAVDVAPAAARSTTSRNGTARCTGARCGSGPSDQAIESVAWFGHQRVVEPLEQQHARLRGVAAAAPPDARYRNGTWLWASWRS